MTKPLIVGIDFGTTTGLSIIDLSKNIIHIKSKKGMRTPDIKKEILSFGKPVIIATDKKKIPTKIKSIAASFDCRVFSPKHDLSIEEKRRIVKRKIRNPHERDSLSAALFTYRFYEKKFRHIEKVLDSKDLRDYEDVVKEMVIQKEAKRLSEAIELLKPKRDTPIIQLTKEVNLDWKEQAEKNYRDFRYEKKRNQIMRIYGEKLDEKIKVLERQKQSYLEEQMQKNEKVRKTILKEKEIKSRDILIDQLKFQISKQKELLKVYEEKIRIEQEEKNIIKDNLIPVVIIPEFSKEQILNVDKKLGVFDKVVFFENIKFSKTASKELEKILPRVVIGNFEGEIEKRLKNAGIIVVNGIEIDRKEFFGVVSPEKIKDVVRKTEKRNFVNWLEDYRRR